MSGNDRRRGMVLQERDRHLLREMATAGVIDREQAKLLGGFHSTTRVNTRLLTLTQAGLLRRFRLGTLAGAAKSLYSLSEKGAQLVGVPYRGLRRRNDETLVADFFVEHQLAINEVYCALKYRPIPVPGVIFDRWIAFHEPLTPRLRLIPDGYTELRVPAETVAMFLEIDLGHESLRVWTEKVRNYLQLAMSGEHERLFGQSRFRVLVIAHSERRMQSIRRTVAPMIDKIFWFSSIEAIHREGLWEAIWFRPTGNARQRLIEQTL
jgi:hypothetical protein